VTINIHFLGFIRKYLDYLGKPEVVLDQDGTLPSLVQVLILASGSQFFISVSAFERRTTPIRFYATTEASKEKLVDL
jgi:hypothetical protein